MKPFHAMLCGLATICLSSAVYAGPKLSETSPGSYKLVNACGYKPNALWEIKDKNNNLILKNKVNSDGCVNTSFKAGSHNQVSPGENLILYVSKKNVAALTVPQSSQSQQSPRSNYESGANNPRSQSNQTQAPQQAAPECTAKAVQDANQQISVQVNCNYVNYVNVTASIEGKNICNNPSVPISEYNYQYSQACQFPALEESANLDVQILYPLNGQQGGYLIFKKTLLVLKKPTFYFPVVGQITSSLQQRPNAKREITFRGDAWKADVTVFVDDKDLDNNSEQIKVILINQKTGKQVSSRTVSANSAASFSVEGKYYIPRFFGDPHWDEDGQLFEGKNTFIVKVCDAYSDSDCEELPEKVEVYIEKSAN